MIPPRFKTGEKVIYKGRLCIVKDVFRLSYRLSWFYDLWFPTYEAPIIDVPEAFLDEVGKPENRAIH